MCDGQILPINQNQSLYSLLGTTYGGDGRTSFALPDLRGRSPIHESGAHPLGSKGGAEAVTLTSAQMPAHQHAWQANTAAGTANGPAAGQLAGIPGGYGDGPAASLVSPHAGTVANTGGGQSHDNMQPSQALNFCIALQGLFPSRN